MPSTYTTNLGIEKIGTGEQSGTWGTTTNTNFDLIDQGVNGIVQVTLAAVGSTGSPNALTIDNGALSDGRNKFIEFVDGGDLGGTAYVQLQPNDSEKVAFIRNSLSGSRSIIIFQGTYNASNDFEIPNGADVVLKFDGAGASATVTQVFENLTVSSATLASGVTVNAILDEDNMASDSDTALATQQSIKAYVDSQVTAQDLDIAGDTGTGAVDLDSQSLTIAGTANEIETSASGQTITVGLPNAVTIADLTATTADINGGTIDGTVIGGSSAAAGTFTTITASGEITANGGIALGDNDKATFGASDDLQIYHDGSNSIINDNGVGSLILRATNFRLFNADQTKVSILANDGSNTSLYYDGSPKLATTATGIDVTGTVTADGLTVDGLAKIQGTAVGLVINETDTTDLNSYLSVNGGVLRLYTVNDAFNSFANRVNVDNSTGDISFYEDTGTTAKFFWDASAESLGIGTTSPSEKLEIFGNAILTTGYKIYGNANTGLTSSYLSLYNAVDGGIDLMANYTTSKITFGTAGSERMRIDSSGNVGIGTSSPSAKTHIHVTETSPSSVGAGVRIQGNTNDYGLNIGADTSYAYIQGVRGDTTTTGYGDLILQPNSGNVGIGTTSPSFPLQINAASGNIVGVFETTTGNTNRLYLGAESTVSYIDATAGVGATNLAFKVASTERMRITSSGNVGIGTTSPAAKLEIGGAGEGIILASPDGTRYKITVANGGILIVTAV